MAVNRLSLLAVVLGLCSLSSSVLAIGEGNGVSVPEPVSLAASLLAGGLLAGGLYLRRRARK
jgi:hypothetical protein